MHWKSCFLAISKQGQRGEWKQSPPRQYLPQLTVKNTQTPYLVHILLTNQNSLELVRPCWVWFPSEWRHALRILPKSRLLMNVKISPGWGVSAHRKRTLTYGKYFLVLRHRLPPCNFGTSEFYLRALRDHSVQQIHFVPSDLPSETEYLISSSVMALSIFYDSICALPITFFPSGTNMFRCSTPSLSWSKFSELLV